MKKLYAGRHFVPFGHIILLPSKQSFAAVYLTEKHQISFILALALEADMLTLYPTDEVLFKIATTP